MNQKYFMPLAPGGTACGWLISDTEDKAWEALMEDASHMPYENKQAFIDRGYTVEEVIEK